MVCIEGQCVCACACVCVRVCVCTCMCMILVAVCACAEHMLCLFVLYQHCMFMWTCAFLYFGWLSTLCFFVCLPVHLCVFVSVYVYKSISLCVPVCFSNVVILRVLLMSCGFAYMYMYGMWQYNFQFQSILRKGQTIPFILFCSVWNHSGRMDNMPWCRHVCGAMVRLVQFEILALGWICYFLRYLTSNRDIQQLQETAHSPFCTNGPQAADYLLHLTGVGIRTSRVGIHKFLQEYKEMRHIAEDPVRADQLR